ncbi:MAG: hypothetical protein ACKPKO_14940 [Candidatus Fonsibacter sp.]
MVVIPYKTAFDRVNIASQVIYVVFHGAYSGRKYINRYIYTLGYVSSCMYIYNARPISCLFGSRRL